MAIGECSEHCRLANDLLALPDIKLGQRQQQPLVGVGQRPLVFVPATNRKTGFAASLFFAPAQAYKAYCRRLTWREENNTATLVGESPYRACHFTLGQWRLPNDERGVAQIGWGHIV